MNVELTTEERLLLHDSGFVQSGELWINHADLVWADKTTNGWMARQVHRTNSGSVYRHDTLGGLLAKGYLRDWA